MCHLSVKGVELQIKVAVKVQGVSLVHGQSVFGPLEDFGLVHFFKTRPEWFASLLMVTTCFLKKKNYHEKINRTIIWENNTNIKKIRTWWSCPPLRWSLVTLVVCSLLLSNLVTTLGSVLAKTMRGSQTLLISSAVRAFKTDFFSGFDTLLFFLSSLSWFEIASEWFDHFHQSF